jgi:hypothetical protein
LNAVEIEEAISQLAEQEFDAESFPYAFLEAFGNKATTIKRLESGSTNSSDLEDGVLQRNNIHIAISDENEVSSTLDQLRNSPATKKGRVKFILATDGKDFQAEELTSGETVACEYKRFPDHFGFFLTLAGITTVKRVRESSFDIRATSRLNRLYVELLKDNPEWGQAERRHDMNHFMARLIFSFFAEDTDIFNGEGLFTQTIEKMSERDSSNTHEVIGEIFRAMNTKIEEREAAKLPRWTNDFPYVNGGLFSGNTDTPKFSKIARSYLIHIGNLDWQQINPDIFGSMIQAVTDDEERGELGMHYTSVPNILKVLSPLFLDDLREKLEEAGDNARTLLNLRKRISKIRVFDPACGSGNFLVIAYKQLREIENEINIQRGEPGQKSGIPITNFRGIELRDFAAEIARLALIIAEYQCDVLYLGQKEALAEFLPLTSSNWIIQGNALRLDWLSICPPTGTGVKLQADDLFETPLEQSEINFENEGGETYICGNPPYLGRRNQSKEQKSDLKAVFGMKIKSFASLDYVFGWLEKASDFIVNKSGEFAFVMTNSVSQGTQVPIYWPHLFSKGLEITFAHRSFKWANNAAHNAGVTVVIIGIGNERKQKKIYEGELVRDVNEISPYLLPGFSTIVTTKSRPISEISRMNYGNLPGDGNHLSLNHQEKVELLEKYPEAKKLILPLYGAQEFIQGKRRYCLWIDDSDLELAYSVPEVARRIEKVKEVRESSKDPSYNALASRPHQYRDRNLSKNSTILVPQVSSEAREYLPTTLLSGQIGTTNQAFALYDAPLWNMALIASRLHLVWIGAVCGKLKTDYRYSNTLGWNTFPIQKLTEKNKEDLTRCSEEILLVRESYFPATIAELYKPENMPKNLRLAHERNDEVLERIYIGRRFKNDTERLEKLFDLYTKMTEKKGT